MAKKKVDAIKPKETQIDVFSFVRSIETDKINLLLEDPELISLYIPVVINMALSMKKSTIFYANAMNEHYQLPPELQYYFYLYSIPKGKRYASWKKTKDLDIITAIQWYYKGYYDLTLGDADAIGIINVLSKEEIDSIFSEWEKLNK